LIQNFDGTHFDCAKAAGACELVAIDVTDVDYHALAPLAFDPNLPPPPPATLTVNPDTKLPYYARVTLTGKNFAPLDFAFIMECPSKRSQDCAIIGAAQTDKKGAFATRPMLERELVDEFGGAPVDCAATHAHCVVTVEGSDGSTTAPVAFDANAPIPPAPSASVTPTGPYTDRQTVTVNGLNFAPKAQYEFGECLTTQDEELCGYQAPRRQVTNADGSLSNQFKVSSRVDDGVGDTANCTSKGATCTLEISSEGGAAVSLPLTFTSSSAGGRGSELRATSVRRLGWFGRSQSPVFRARSAFPRVLLSSLRPQ
jgi:Neocarzinostatin family